MYYKVCNKLFSADSKNYLPDSKKYLRESKKFHGDIFIEESRGVLQNACPNYFPQSAYSWNKRATQSLSVKESLVGKP